MTSRNVPYRTHPLVPRVHHPYYVTPQGSCDSFTRPYARSMCLELQRIHRSTTKQPLVYPPPPPPEIDPRQLGFSENKSRQFEEVIPRYAVSHKPLTTVANEGDVLKLQGDETADEEFSFVCPGLDMNAPVESLYSLLLDQRARKKVPVGPDHQAMLPEWEGSQKRKLVSEINRRVSTNIKDRQPTRSIMEEIFWS
ncbi:hypothetical protein Bca52824_014073 [Brassica carinata]|uniref:ELM2 domain-containing protein n=1 Tax=Brassica carinata TaxID=52824 RepID=A0A8X8B330_BRACI|nr:hypothetical protein Bca52824_014073 [Brassica carinata]